MTAPIHCERCRDLKAAICECDCHPIGVKWLRERQQRLRELAEIGMTE